MSLIPARSFLALLALLSACGQSPAEPDPVETLDLNVAAGDPDITANATWTVGGATVTSTVSSIAIRNGWITLRYESSTGDALLVVVPTRRGDVAITGTGVSSEEAAVRLTRAGTSTPLVGSINVGRVHLRNDEGGDVLVDLDIDLRGATLTGVGSVTGGGSACLDRHSTAVCGEEPPRT